MKRTRKATYLAGLLTVMAAAILAAGPAAAGEADASAATGSDAGAGTETRALFTENDLLLFDVYVGDDQLADSFAGYSSRSGVYLPLGALSRLLDLAVTVDPNHGRAEGWVLSEDRALRLDIMTQQAAVGGRVVDFSNGDAVLRDDDIYLRTSLLEKLLPVTFGIDTHGLILTLTPKEKLPFQMDAERQARLGALSGGMRSEPVLTVPAPYKMFTPPSVDVTLTGMASNRPGGANSSYTVRAAGDVAFFDAQLFAASDNHGTLDQLRFTLDKKDPEGHMAGPLGLTQISLGDTFTPQLSMGARSAGGRGFQIRSEPLSQVDVFNKIDLHGELPPGYQVELYIGEVLRAAQMTPVEGRYDFTGVSLSYGLNVIRLVFYGPHGERREEVRKVNVGGGQLGRGETTFNLGVVENGVALFNVAPKASTGLPQGDTRITANFARGLTSTTTLSGAYAHYSPVTGVTRDLGVAGLATSLGGVATKVNLGVDNTGATDAAIGLAGLYKGVSVLFRHSEYSGDFRDETVGYGSGLSALRRDTLVNFDYFARFFGASQPLQVSLEQAELVDGPTYLNVSALTSRPVGLFLVSSALNYNRITNSPVAQPATLNGSLSLSGRLSNTWQMRGNLDYTFEPNARLDTAAISFDRQSGQGMSAHIGYARSFGTLAGDTMDASATWHLKALDLSLLGGYSSVTGETRIGFELSTGFGFDPAQRRYRPFPPGVASGGSMVLQAFLDRNGNGIRDADEEGMPGIAAASGLRTAASNANGELTITGLGDGTSARARLDTSAISDPYLLSPPQTLVTVPRPGRILLASYPMSQSGEVEINVSFTAGQDTPRGLAALSLQLLDEKGTVAAAARSEYDGSVILDSLRPGVYELRIDPKESIRLGLVLQEPVYVSIPSTGGFVGRVPARVRKKTIIEVALTPGMTP